MKDKVERFIYKINVYVGRGGYGRSGGYFNFDFLMNIVEEIN